MKPKYLKKFKKRISFAKDSRYKSPIKKIAKKAKKIHSTNNSAGRKGRVTRNGRVSSISRPVARWPKKAMPSSAKGPFYQS